MIACKQKEINVDICIVIKQWEERILLYVYHFLPSLLYMEKDSFSRRWTLTTQPRWLLGKYDKPVNKRYYKLRYMHRDKTIGGKKYAIYEPIPPICLL